jgi:hypothetical protein
MRREREGGVGALVLRLPLSRDHLAFISGITPVWRPLLLVQDHPYKSPDIVRFLKQLPRHIPGTLLVIWDGAPIQRGQPAKAVVAQGGARRIRLEQFPGYAPDVNADEGIWTYLKHVELGSVSCQSLPQLRRHLRLATARLRRKRSVIQGRARECGDAVRLRVPGSVGGKNSCTRSPKVRLGPKVPCTIPSWSGTLNAAAT